MRNKKSEHKKLTRMKELKKEDQKKWNLKGKKQLKITLQESLHSHYFM